MGKPGAPQDLVYNLLLKSSGVVKFVVQDCEPLWIKTPGGARFKFEGVAAIAAGNVAADVALSPSGEPGQTDSLLGVPTMCQFTNAFLINVGYHPSQQQSTCSLEIILLKYHA